MRASIFLASRSEGENQILARKLVNIAHESGLRLIGVHPQGLAGSVDPLTALVIFNHGDWNKSSASHLIDLRNTGYEGPILVLAKGEFTGGDIVLEVLKPFLFLSKPFETKALVGVVSKLLTSDSQPQQIHQRFMTLQKAEVEFFGTNSRVNTRLCNLSKGGAFLEFALPVPVKVGQMMRLTVPLGEVNRSYTVSAKVVWTMRSTSYGGPGIGVEFVGKGGVQKL